MKQSRNFLLAGALLGALGFLQIENRAQAAVSLSEALDAPSLAWSTVGSPAWEGQSILASDGVDAAMSGVVADGTAVTIQTTVTGPGTVSFWWKVSSELTNDYLKFFISGSQQLKISGEVDWQQQTFNVPAGSQTLKWTYSKNASGSAGLDCGWVDRVQYALASNCTFIVSPTSPLHGPGRATGSVSVATSAGCPWNIVNSNTWVDIPTGVINLGSGTVAYTLATNEGPTARRANLTIAGQTFTINQLAPGGCSYAVSPSTRTHGYGGATNSVSVAVALDCPWTLVNSNVWLTFSGPPSGSGNATLPYTVAVNPTTQTRTGIVNIAGQIVVVTQLGVPCNYALSPASRDHGAGATSGAINVTTALPCTWNAVTTNSWITILPGTNNVGTGIVNYTLSANPSVTRTGVIVIAGQAFTVHQAGAIPLALARQPNGDVTLSFGGILQSAATVNGTFEDVPGNPQGSYTIQKGSLEMKRFFRTRTP